MVRLLTILAATLLVSACSVRKPVPAGPLIKSTCMSWTFRATEELNRKTDPELTLCRHYDRQGRITFVDNNNFVLRDSLFTYDKRGTVTAYEISKDGPDTVRVDLAVPANNDEEVRRDDRGRTTYRRYRTGKAYPFVVELHIEYDDRGRVSSVRESACQANNPTECTRRTETRSYEEDVHGNWTAMIKRSEYPDKQEVKYSFTRRDIEYYD